MSSHNLIEDAENGQLDEQQYRELTPQEKQECRDRAANYMRLKANNAERATWAILETRDEICQREQRPSELSSEDEAEVFGEPTTNNKAWVMQAMGFVSRGPARWWHPVLGEDFDHNWLLFDLETDDLKSLPPKLYRTGWVYGQRDIRMKFKKVLDI